MTLAERLRASLASEYEVREEIGRGAMGAVFMARDSALDRTVAIKVLLPEQATARAVERFLREARALAAIEHPRVVRIYHAGEADGLYYYVMERVSGETLAERLERGPLTPAEVRALADDLLEGLAAIHDVGIIHRDVKPSNIFLVEGRAVLGDFGIALKPESDERITRAEELVGTPRYLAPEQLYGEASPATDVFAAGLVLYEACTGRAWMDVVDSSSAWKGVPRRLRAPLRRALRQKPEFRWPDAGAFRAAMRQRVPLRARVVAVGVLVIVAVLVVVGLLLGPSSPSGSTGEVADLAVLPFQVGLADGRGASPGPCDLEGHVGCRLAHLVTVNLSGLPQLKVIQPSRVVRIEPAGMAAVDSTVRRSLRARYLAHGPVEQRGDVLELSLVVEDSLGQRMPERTVTGQIADPLVMADSVALALVRMLLPQLEPSFRGLEEVATGSLEAMRQFLLGEDAFHRNAWNAADQHYVRALAIDSSFALAAWRRWNVFRWRLTGEEVVDLDRLLAEHGDDLPAVERALLAAEAQSPGTERIAALEATAERYGYVAFLHWLLADELHHRGPLIGRPVEEAVRRYQEAAARNPYLGPVYEHSLLALIRLGREAEARSALDRLMDVSAPPAPGEVLYYPRLLQQALLERFEPERAAAQRDSLFDLSDPEQRGVRGPVVEFAARMALLFDLPEAQLDLGRRLVAAGRSPANGYTAQGLALMVRGRPVEALSRFDSAVALSARPERPAAALEAAEWRVVLPAVGVYALPDAEIEEGRRHLQEVVGAGAALTPRAAWALALDACAAGDLEAARRWRGLITVEGDDPERRRLRRLAMACESRMAGGHREVLALTEPLLADQFLPRDRDPFTRTVLHLLRAEAYRALDQPADARRERLWSDNSDITHVLGGRIQAVEVDWAASPYSDRHRARLALAQGDTTAACQLLGRLDWLWADVEPRLEDARAGDRRLREESCP